MKKRNITRNFVKMSNNLKKSTAMSIVEVATVDSETSNLSNDNNNKLVLNSNGEEKKKHTSCFTAGGVGKLIVSAICGLCFGFILEKARVFEPKAIREQFVFEMFIMLKTFLAAVAAAQLCFAMLSVIPPMKGKFEQAVEEYTSCFQEKSLLTSAFGAFVLGVGMALSGSCPAMVLVQVGTWVPNAIFSLLGCLLGALVYGMIAPILHRITRPKKQLKNHSVGATFKLPFIALALPMALALAVVVFLLEWFWPWTKDTKDLGKSNLTFDNVFTVVSWPPYASGILLGLIELPIVIFVQDTIGGSSAYVTVVSQWVVTEKLQEYFPYLASKRQGVGNWWQVFLVSGAVIGGLISASASDTLAKAYGVPVYMGFIGGFLMIFGARFAGGCTSGHGISGMGLLIWMSFIAVPFMFGGAIATGFAMQATGALDTYVTYTGAI